MGGQGLLLLIGLKLLIIMTSLQNIVILCAQGLLMLMGSKFLIKMTRPQNIVLYRIMFCGLVIFIKNFDPINIRRPCAHKITMFCSEVMMIKSINPIKSRRPWPPISISHLFQQGPFSSWPLLFLHLGCFCLDFTSFFKKNYLYYIKCCQL